MALVINPTFRNEGSRDTIAAIRDDRVLWGSNRVSIFLENTDPVAKNDSSPGRIRAVTTPYPWRRFRQTKNVCLLSENRYLIARSDATRFVYDPL